MATKTTTQTQHDSMADLLEEVQKTQARAIDEAASIMKLSLALTTKFMQSSQNVMSESGKRFRDLTSSMLNDQQ